MSYEAAQPDDHSSFFIRGQPHNPRVGLPRSGSKFHGKYPIPSPAVRFLLIALLLLSATLAVLLCFFVDFNRCSSSSSEGCVAPLCAVAKDVAKQPQDMLLRRGGREVDLYVGIIADVHLAVETEPQCETDAKFGLYGCDSKEALVNATLSDLRERLAETEHHIVLMIGDAAKHQTPRDWNPRVALENNERFYQLVAEKLPGIPVFPVLGNNDLPAHNELPPVSWCSHFLSHFTNAVLPPSPSPFLTSVTTPRDFTETILRGGYYTATVDTPHSPPMTVIALNTVLFNCKVSLVTEQREQAAAQLAWLELTLGQSRGRVIIIGHHPLTNNMGRIVEQARVLPDWRAEYYHKFRGVVERHQEKVVGMFFGHEHIDTMVTEEWARGHMVVFGVPSITASFSGEPSYQIAVLDSSHLDLSDIYTFNTRLSMNHTGTAVFRQRPSLSEIVGSGVSPGELSTAIKSLGKSEELYQSLRRKMYGGRYFPKQMTVQIFHCFYTNMAAEGFSQCIREHGYPESAFPVEIA